MDEGNESKGLSIMTKVIELCKKNGHSGLSYLETLILDHWDVLIVLQDGRHFKGIQFHCLISAEILCIPGKPQIQLLLLRNLLS